MKVQELIKLLGKFEIENPSVIAASSRDEEKATNIETIIYNSETKLLILRGDEIT